jgi:hypothetical protein
VVRFIDGGKWSTRRKPPTSRKSLTKLITKCCTPHPDRDSNSQHFWVFGIFEGSLQFCNRDTCIDLLYGIYFFFYPKWLIKWKYKKYHIPHCRNSSNMQYIANSSCHCGSYGSIWTGTSPNKYYVDRSFWGPYNIFLVTDRSIYCRMTRSDMNYLLYYTFYLK